MENYDLKTAAWKEEDINVRNSIKKKVRLGNQMMLILIFLDFFESNDEALTAVFFETGAMSVPTKSKNPTIYG